MIMSQFDFLRCTNFYCVSETGIGFNLITLQLFWTTYSIKYFIIMASSSWFSVPDTIWQIKDWAHSNGSFFSIRSQSIPNFSILNAKKTSLFLTLTCLMYRVYSELIELKYNSSWLIACNSTSAKACYHTYK